MTVRRLFFAFVAAAALLLSSGCGGNGNTVTADETSDPLYEQAQELKKEGRNGEALSAFLKVIDHRGENGAPESQLEAGTLCLTWSKDPVEAYHHFRKYLELQPSGPRAKMVQGQCDAAKREIARVLLAPSSDQMVQLGRDDEIDQLKRQIQDLKAENETLRGSGAGVVAARNPTMISLPDDHPAAPAAAVAATEATDSPITPAPTPAPADSGFYRPATPVTAVPAQPVAGNRPSPITRAPASAPRSTTPQRPAAPAGARSHTVTQKESLWGIARRYYGSSVNAAKVRGIYEANRDVMKNPGDLRSGMVLRIP